jgi:lysozyme
MQTSQNGKKLIKSAEAFRSQVYKDSAGYSTIGYGHKLTAIELQRGLFSQGITIDQASSLLDQDVRQVEIQLTNLVTVPLTQNQFDALISFVFNLGVVDFQESTLLKLLNLGEYMAAASQFPCWVKAKDPITDQYITLPGLVTRRQAEMQLFLTPENQENVEKTSTTQPPSGICQRSFGESPPAPRSLS